MVSEQIAGTFVSVFFSEPSEIPSGRNRAGWSESHQERIPVGAKRPGLSKAIKTPGAGVPRGSWRR